MVDSRAHEDPVEQRETADLPAKTVDSWLQFSIVTLVFTSTTAYFFFSYGIRNHVAFLKEAAEKTLQALGVGS